MKWLKDLLTAIIRVVLAGTGKVPEEKKIVAEGNVGINTDGPHQEVDPKPERETNIEVSEKEESDVVAKPLPYTIDETDNVILDDPEDDDDEKFKEAEDDHGDHHEDAFQGALKLVLQYEGGYVNHPNDPGGETNKGVTKAVYDSYRKNKGLEVRSVKDIADEEIEEIYRKRYWIAGYCHVLPWKLAIAHFDTAVNAGTRQAAKFLQRSVGAVDDGKIGPKTIQAVADSVESEALQAYLSKRRDFYEYLARKNPPECPLKVFLKGWMKRVDHLEHYIEEQS